METTMSSCPLLLLDELHEYRSFVSHLYLQTLALGRAHGAYLLQFLYWTFPLEVHMHLQSYVQSEHIISLISAPTPSLRLSCVQSSPWIALNGTKSFAFWDIDFQLVIKKQKKLFKPVIKKETLTLLPVLPKRFRQKNLLQKGDLRMQLQPSLN